MMGKTQIYYWYIDEELDGLDLRLATYLTKFHVNVHLFVNLPMHYCTFGPQINKSDIYTCVAF
jgi:hypothetical protein